MIWDYKSQSMLYNLSKRADTRVRPYKCVFKSVLISIVIILSASPSFAGPNESDRWFAKDKYKHFALSAFYSAGIAKVAQRHFENSKQRSILIGCGITISLGAMKEGIDYKFHKGKASYKDFIWDMVGTLFGALAGQLTL